MTNKQSTVGNEHDEITTTDASTTRHADPVAGVTAGHASTAANTEHSGAGAFNASVPHHRIDSVKSGHFARDSGQPGRHANDHTGEPGNIAGNSAAGTAGNPGTTADHADRDRDRRPERATERPASSPLDGSAGQARGLTLRSVIEDANYHSAQASNNTRFLAVGGVAAVWVLVGDKIERLRSPVMWLALLAFVSSLGADYFHYQHAFAKLSAAIKKCAAEGATYDSLVPLRPSDLPAEVWFKWKTRFLKLGYAVLACAFVVTVFPETVAGLHWLVSAAMHVLTSLWSCSTSTGINSAM